MWSISVLNPHWRTSRIRIGTVLRITSWRNWRVTSCSTNFLSSTTRRVRVISWCSLHRGTSWNSWIMQLITISRTRWSFSNQLPLQIGSWSRSWRRPQFRIGCWQMNWIATNRRNKTWRIRWNCCRRSFRSNTLNWCRNVNGWRNC